MVNDILIVGAGGFGREVFAYAQDVGIEISGFLDQNTGALNDFDLPVNIVGDIQSFQVSSSQKFIIAIGNTNTRRRIALSIEAQGGKLQTLIHPTAYVPTSAIIEDGCILCPFAMVGVSSHLQKNVVLNAYASVGHDAIVGEHSVFSPYSVVNGNVELGEAVFLGSQAVVTPAKKVGLNSKLSAGAIVSRNIPAGSLVAGNPAKGRVMFPIKFDV